MPEAAVRAPRRPAAEEARAGSTTRSTTTTAEHRLRLLQPAVLRAGRLLRARRPVHREAERDERARADLRVVDRALPRRRLPRRHGQARNAGVLPSLGAEHPRRGEGGRNRPTSRSSGEVTTSDAVDLSDYVRTRGLPQVLDFPYQQVASAYAAARPVPRGWRTAAGRRLLSPAERRRSGLPRPSSATTTWAGRPSRSCRRRPASTQTRSPAASCSVRPPLPPPGRAGRDVRRRGRDDRLRRRPAARQDMFPTRSPTGGPQPRVGSAPIGTGSSFDVVDNPIEAQPPDTVRPFETTIRPSSTGASVVRYAKDAVLVVSRIDTATGTSSSRPSTTVGRRCTGDRAVRDPGHVLGRRSSAPAARTPGPVPA